MTTYNPEVLVNPAVLRKVGLKSLFRIIASEPDYFRSRNLPTSTSPTLDEEAFYSALAEIIAKPTPAIPASLAETICSIDTLAGHAFYDRLLSVCRSSDDDAVEPGETPTAAELAVRVWFDHPNTAYELLTRANLRARRCFSNFLVDGDTSTRLQLEPEQKRAFEVELASHYSALGTASEAEIEFLQGSEDSWMVIRRGRPLHIEGTVGDASGRRSVAFFPLHYDIVSLSLDGSVVRINAGSSDTAEFLKAVLPRWLFTGQVSLHPRKASLQPLLLDAKSALKITGFEDRLAWVRLKRIKYQRGAVTVSETAKTDLLFEYPNGLHLGRGLAGVKLFEATLEVKLKSRGGGRSAAPRAITLRDGEATTTFTRDQDAALLERWLTNRGFL